MEGADESAGSSEVKTLGATGAGEVYVAVRDGILAVVIAGGGLFDVGWKLKLACVGEAKAVSAGSGHELGT